MEQREILSFVISGCVMLFVLFQWPHLRKLPHARLLLGSFSALFASWGFSVIEAFFWETGLNFLQHLSSGVGGILLALWSRALFRTRNSRGTAQ
jgi:hypothetical protein